MMNELIIYLCGSAALIVLCLAGLWLVTRGGDADDAIERLRELRGEPTDKRK